MLDQSRANNKLIKFYKIRIENIRLSIDSISNDLRIIDNWANANGLCINPSESDIIGRGKKINMIESVSNLLSLIVY